MKAIRTKYKGATSWQRLMEQAKSRLIRELNDDFRSCLVGGRVVLTPGVYQLGEDLVTKIVRAVRDFDTFNVDNDPWGEHDFGSLTVEDNKIFWKMDYYDRALQMGSPDPTDPNVTTRVLTVMLAEEY